MKNVRMVTVAGVFVAAFAVAWIFRYEPMQIGIVWDRWTHQICTVDWDRNIHCNRS